MKVMLKNVRLAFPRLWEAEQFDNAGKKRYGATLLVAPGSDNDKAIREAIKIEAEGKWGAKAPAMIKALSGDTGKFCYQDGIMKAEKHEGFEGLWYINANRNEDQGAPAVIDKNKQLLKSTDGKPYAGCYVNASVDIWVQTGQYQGVRATLITVQFAGDGDAFAGAPVTTDDFDDLTGGEEDDDLSAFGSV